MISINKRNRERKYHYYVHSFCALQFITLVLHNGRKLGERRPTLNLWATAFAEDVHWWEKLSTRDFLCDMRCGAEASAAVALLLLPDPYRHLNKYMFISNACLFGCCLATIYGRRMDGIPIPSHQTCTSQRWYRISQWRVETAKRSSWRR